MNRRQFVLSSGTAGVLAAAAQSPAAAAGHTPDQETKSPRSAAQSSQRSRVLSEHEIVDLMVGSSIHATRNSDTPGMIKRARRLMAEGRQFRVIEHAQVPDEWNVICAAGGVAALIGTQSSALSRHAR